ncbi:hypothetical protein Agabi119p4_8555 [Agaricus bisporus var. burnettii]|uniref:Uncharacterized protein n=1 Tax=Agaricus bisporus var. burnettii TaxID=192524 RepID=A0A8H7C872_AGABI|nr:hypothetical protein Agabi119p4_8555 [Agaricus bisporus var. burnettii]
MEKKPKPLPDFKKSGKWGGPQMLILILYPYDISSSSTPHVGTDSFQPFHALLVRLLPEYIKNRNHPLRHMR